MCGILGLASIFSNDKSDTLILQRDAMVHRGPDDAGVWWSADLRVALAHRRLAIVDLSPGGHQPMLAANGRYCITFNGEIYNFQELRQILVAKGYIFRSSSDTEIILAAYEEWGIDCLQYLNGMFAFGLYDADKQQLFLARDRVGEKPLFYQLTQKSILFASELKALMADPAFPRRLNLDALDCYLASGYVPGELCILQGVKKLPPAHALTFDLNSGRTRIWRYWQIPDSPTHDSSDSPANTEALLDELECLLERAVKRQLVADVPVGILLSGGVDSSLTTAMAAQAVSNVKTFTIRFPGYGHYDETEHARLIAQHFDTDHIELEAEPSTIELLPLLARQFDEPMVDSSMIPTYLVCKLARRYCTVVLGGDGGDELFGGYLHYSRLLRIQERLGWLPYALRRAGAGLASDYLPSGFKGRNWLRALDYDIGHGLPPIPNIFFSPSERRRLVRQDLRDRQIIGKAAEHLRLRCIPLESDLLQRATRMDFANYLPEDILVKVDRASMLTSLEMRAPWLDYHIVEFAFGKIPASLRATTAGRKVISKLLAQRLLPAKFDVNRKWGFSIPLSTWLKEKNWSDFFQQILLESDSQFFCKDYVKKLFDKRTKGGITTERLFGLVLFELWAREYRVQY